ncbi:MAG: MmcQ/YjbR family DNA-binding protein [Candidatus Kapabacteria bacterium]|nr:MmcQ/YjbR family DNA-binding protein [Candidatus Kapabacteria bacterium]
MDIVDLCTYALSLGDVEETFPFGPDVIVYKVRGKVFLLVPLDTTELRFNVKCDPERAIELRERHACVLPGYHMNKKHWNTVVVDGSVSATDLKGWVEHSYDLVSGRRRRS